MHLCIVFVETELGWNKQFQDWKLIEKIILYFYKINL